MAEKMTRTKKRFALALAAVLTLVGAGAAFAYWSSTGTGDGTAATGESTAFTIAVDDAVGEISPGSAGQTVGFRITNPGTGTQNVTPVDVAMASPTGVAWVPPVGCDIDDYTAAMTSAPTGPLAAGATSANGVVTVTLASTAENQDACKGQTVPLYFTVS